jgi:hypothetical protein
MEIHAAAPLLFEPSPSEVGISIEKLEKYKPPRIRQIPAELTRKIESFVLRFMKCLSSGMSLLVHLLYV